MAALSPILRSVKWGNGLAVSFWCPGCDSAHIVNVERGAGEGGPCWGYNSNPEAPTFSPSILVTYNGTDAGIDGAPPSICHSFVNDGKIQFLDDCTHPLAGKTVPIPEWPINYHDGDS